MGLFDRRRPEPAWRHEDPKVRRTAVGQLEDPSILAEIARGDADDRVREEALGVLHGLALEGGTEVALSALAGLAERRHLVSVARSASHEGVSRAALSRLADAKALGSVARHGRHVAICLEALERIGEPAELGEVARKSEHDKVALAALERLVARHSEGSGEAGGLSEILKPVAERARTKTAARRARAILRDDAGGGRSAAEPEAGRSRSETDRKRQIELCESMESLVDGAGSKRLAAHIAEIREGWINLLPDVDEELQQRFDRALQAAREHQVRNQAELEEQRRREKEEADFMAKNIAPRRALCEMVESAPLEEAARRLEDARFEWEHLALLLTEEGQALQRRFEEACAACEKRLEIWRAEREAERERAEREAERQARERRLAENQRRLTQLCTRLERQLEADSLSLDRAVRGLREVEAALGDPGPLPTRKERDAFGKRLKAIHSALYPKVMELRESAEWKQWANTRVQEDLCAQAEALRQIESPLEAARRLTGIQEQWRKASQLSGEKARELWLRFKAARDETRSRLEAFRGGHAARKTALCEQAEALAESSEWTKTADLLKGLQAEWKSIGPAGPAPDRALWERFRKACNHFFTRRKEDLKERRRELGRNRQAREALCVQAEAMVDSTDWQATAAAYKKLQADWKAVGAVVRKDSEALWRRFRGACDRFFERYKRRDEIDREARAAAKEALCRELEALAPAEETSSGAAPAADSAAPAPAEGLVEALRASLQRWRDGGPIPGSKGSELEARFETGLGRVIAAFPEVVQGSEFDAQRNVAVLADLCARVERLLPQDEAPDDSAVSPASRLAAMWVERMAANTIGGGVSDEAKWRAAAEEVKKAQAAWQRIGYVPEAARRPLASRFERACGRILQEHERRRAVADPRPGGPAPSSRQRD